MARRFESPGSEWIGPGFADPLDTSELTELIEAVREHERTTARRTVPKRPADHQLYRRLAEIEAPPGERRNGGMR